jgi:hypothetical protein
MSHNPYEPPQTPSSVTVPAHSAASTLLRNLIALLVVTTAYSFACMVFAFSHTAMPEAVFFWVLLAAATGASAWANLPLGAQMGWARGGLPVTMVLFFAALMTYGLIALVVGGALYSWIHPTTLYSPYSSSAF